MVHGLGGAHIGNDVLDSSLLVSSFLERKLGTEGAVLRFFHGVGKTGTRFAFGVDIQQLCRHVAHPFTGLAFGPLPLTAAELVQRCQFGRPAAVTADEMQGRDRHV